ncbi:MAG TPA: MraY family glycosyltransferase [Acidimicrobiales bacterium]|jgi:UDP-GlcNAc:undecaprenyl-phosphate GlcNAc-1-phosphate transferase
MSDELVVLAVAFGVTFTLTPLMIRIANRVGAVVVPDVRHVHPVPTPLLGGAAMFGGFIAAFLVATQLDRYDAAFSASSEPWGILLGALAIYVVGLMDDLRPVSAPAKVAGQVMAGSVLYLLGVTMLFFRIPFADTVVLSPDFAPLLTVLWVVGMANAINLIDGLDGLAAGIVAIAAGAFFLYTERLTDAGVLGADSASGLIALITLGLCLGFLPHNFNPARIFMGDAGSMLLGLLMASATIMVGGRTDDPFSGQTFFFFAPLFIPFFILGVPIIDTAFAIVRRLIRHADVAAPDREHLHHRLVRLGHGHRRSVLILWAWTAILSGFVLYPTYTKTGDPIVPFGVAALGAALYTFFHPGIRARANRLEMDSEAERVAAGVDGDGSAVGPV